MTIARSYYPVLLLRVLLLTSLLSACKGCESQRDAELRLGLSPWGPYEYFFLAQEKGYYEEAGVRVRFLEYQTLADVRRAFERGQIDGMGCTPIEITQTLASDDKRLKMVFVTDYSHGADVILATHPISSVEQLRGRKVGVEVGSLGIYVLAKALQKHGLTLADVHVVPSEQTPFKKKLQLGLVDAVVTFPPFSVELNEEKELTKIFSSAEIPGDLPSALAFDASIIEKRSEDITRIILGYEKAKALAAEDPEAVAFMARRQGISVSDFRSSFDGINLVTLAEQKGWYANQPFMESKFRMVMQTLKDVGQISKNVEYSGPYWDGGSVVRALRARSP